MSKRTYKAYGARGELLLSTWATSYGSQSAEEAAYQARLNRGDFISVEVTSDDPHERSFKMHPRTDRGAA